MVQFTANLRQINACLGVDMNCVLHRATYGSRKKKRLFYGQADRKRLPCPPLRVCEFLCVFFIIPLALESHKCCHLLSTSRDLGLTMTLEKRWGGRGGERIDTVLQGDRLSLGIFF